MSVPLYLQSTVSMLKLTYPSGVPQEEYYALIYVLKNKGEMTDRTASEAIAGLKGGNYTLYLYDVAHKFPNTKTDESIIAGVIDKLSEHGYEKWLEED